MRDAWLSLSPMLYLAVFLSTVGAQEPEPASITWESYKEVEVDFGSQLLRVGSDYQTYAYATGAPTGWQTAYPDPELTVITGPVTSAFRDSSSSASEATASAVAGWLLDKNDATGIAMLSNSAAGTTTIADKYDPTLVAMSWAAQSTSLELGQEVAQGQIDWSPGVFVGASGGGFVSSYDVVSIHDPVIVWTRNVETDVVEPTTLFELNAEFDAKTKFHWNRIRSIRLGNDGQPEFVEVPNDGPFLDASAGGTGSFRLEMQSDLIPEAQRGTLSVVFEEGVITSSTATGVFSDVAAVEAGVTADRLPNVGTEARIDSINVTNTETDGKFALDVNVGAQRLISDVAACSDGVHISLGPAVDSIQNFTADPLQRVTHSARAPGSVGNAFPNPCLGEVSPDADLLFGNDFSDSAGAQLVLESPRNPIDRVLRVRNENELTQQAVVFEPGRNLNPEETRNWTARFAVRRPTIVSPPVEPTPVDPNSVTPQPDGGALSVVQPLASRTVQTQTEESERNQVAAATDATLEKETSIIGALNTNYAFGLLERKTIVDGTESASETVSDTQNIVEHVSFDQGVVLRFSENLQSTLVEVLVDRTAVAKALIPSRELVVLNPADAWKHFQLSLEQTHAGMGIQLDLLDRHGKPLKKVVDTIHADYFIPDIGYQMALGASGADSIVDFDNLLVTFRQAGDVAWNGEVDTEDFHLFSDILNGVESEVEITNRSQRSVLDVNLNGRIDFGDLEYIEDLIPDKPLGDANLDGQVNFADVLILSRFFETQTGLWSRGDFDSSGDVGFGDFLILAKNFGVRSSQGAAAVPESVGFGICWMVLVFGRLRSRRRGRIR